MEDWVLMGSTGCIGSFPDRGAPHGSSLPRHSLSRFSASLSRSLSHSQSLTVCARAKGRTKKEGKEKEEGEGSGDAGDKGENEGKITEMPLTLNLTTFYTLP